MTATHSSNSSCQFKMGKKQMVMATIKNIETTVISVTKQFLVSIATTTKVTMKLATIEIVTA